MSDAFECDRCGELGGGPPEIRVATSGQVAGYINKIAEDDEPGRSITSPRPQIGTLSPKTFTRTEIKKGDLCDDCAEAFREFWEVAD